MVQGERLLATHIPVLAIGSPDDFYLFAHIANHNEQLHHLKDGAEALIVFQGPHSYVSSSWYKEKDISTWDYSAVHVNAKIAVQTDWELEESLQKLIARFERDQDKPLYYQDIPEDIIRDHLPYITGFWLQS
ncbi:FMN-binding negative transcriptional regulator [Antarcticibacterium sp. 1MA-6-2]|uniref:FMN-binding negative transcriptional regulator n=1 Tax=Antarcticibacterium sp. 1MA-6-2 TaxID=2908210 RepID=UPI001F1E5510|nr:FMN-binding negative transcriptional regulator [Antarcticibacterium sp. 1MA-6-2]UJH89901.1 FMN-binding negative transcriptional regulator [Antarcticibacterium sp. 1MA-6-2]